jgi:hypothetical protein
MIWGWDDDKRLGDWGIIDRHRKRAYGEGFRDGIGFTLGVATIVVAIIFLYRGL